MTLTLERLDVSMTKSRRGAVTPRNGAGTNVWAFGMTALFGSVAVIGP